MSIVFLDLEWNNAYSKLHKRFVNEIIEIGAVKLDDSFNEIDRIDIIIKSQITKKLACRFKNLTSITNEEMREGVPFNEAFKKFLSWCGKDFLTVTWSNSDLYAIIENFQLFYNKFPDNCFETYLDLQRYYQSIVPTENGNQVSLKTAAQTLNIPLDDVALHRASDDSAVTAKIFKEIVNKGDLSKFISDTRVNQFYERLAFKAYCIDDINSEYINKDDFVFFCDKCGKTAIPQSEWKVANKQFSNIFFCKHCKANFLGRVRIKKYFDCTKVKKSTTPLAKKPRQFVAKEEKSEISL